MIDVPVSGFRKNRMFWKQRHSPDAIWHKAELAVADINGFLEAFSLINSYRDGYCVAVMDFDLLQPAKTLDLALKSSNLRKSLFFHLADNGKIRARLISQDPVPYVKNMFQTWLFDLEDTKAAHLRNQDAILGHIELMLGKIASFERLYELYQGKEPAEPWTEHALFGGVFVLEATDIRLFFSFECVD